MDIVSYDAAFERFQQAAAALSGGSTQICKFEKGDWLLGQEKDEVPNGTLLAIDMMRAEWGWVRWYDNRPVERKMVLVASGQPVPMRAELGHRDEAMWARDDSDRPRDPWQRMIDIPAREVTGAKREMILSGGSRGWDGCCKDLFATFGEQMRENRGKTPVVRLGTSSYEHKKYGRVKVPTLELVEWRSPVDLAELEKNGGKKPTKIATAF
jgi:hypothetical protein